MAVNEESQVVVRIGAVLQDITTGDLLVREATLPSGEIVIDVRVSGAGSPEALAEAVCAAAPRYRSVHGLGGAIAIPASVYHAASQRAADAPAAESAGTPAETSADDADPDAPKTTSKKAASGK